MVMGLHCYIIESDIHQRCRARDEHDVLQGFSRSHVCSVAKCSLDIGSKNPPRAHSISDYYFHDPGLFFMV